MKDLIFVVADCCRTQLERVTQILVSSFPGSTIYQHTDPLHVAHDVLSHKVDAVLLEAKMGSIDSLDLMQKLRRQKPGLPVFIISKTDAHYKEAIAAGANGCFVMPDSEQLLLESMRLAIKKERVS